MGSVCSWTESTVLNTKFEPNTSVLSADIEKLLDPVIVIQFRIYVLFSKKIACSVPQTSLKKARTFYGIMITGSHNFPMSDYQVTEEICPLVPDFYCIPNCFDS